MNSNINILRLVCLIQDRDNQDFKRVILSVIFEILYENNNIDLKADELFIATVSKSKEPIERDFFDHLLFNSTSFEVTNTENEPLIRLTPNKFQEVEKNISDFSIEPSIDKFLHLKGYNEYFKEPIINILYQSIYENIYAFNPNSLESLVPEIIQSNFDQQALNIFNEFLEYDDPEKNRRLYNQFVKAIEFAILTSGKGVKQFSDNIFTGKTYILDTNIIFRMLGVGGEERKNTINTLIKACIKQGVSFEFTMRTQKELSNTLDSSILKISKAEQARNIDIMQDLISEAPHFFNDDFIIQYSRLKNAKIVSSPEQYGIEMKSRFKTLCEELNLCVANHTSQVRNNEIPLFAKRLIDERKKITNYKYSTKQAEVDAYNILYVNKKRGSNNYNYSEVKSFYLTTDRGLNKILADDQNIPIPATILPSQLFAIHNPLNDNSDDIDFENFFSFLKRRTSEFKHRGRDIFSFIHQARMYTTEKEEIKKLILTFIDERYTHSKIESVEENVLICFKDFAKTYFDNRLDALENAEEIVGTIEYRGRNELESKLFFSKKASNFIEILMVVIIIPAVSYFIGEITNFYGMILSLFSLEGLKYFASKNVNLSISICKFIFLSSMKNSPYYKLTCDDKYIQQGKDEIENSSSKFWMK